jgi:hypothetical protein
MKPSKLIAGLGLAILGSMTVSANAQTTTVPSGCSWTLVSQQSGPSSAIITMDCKLNGVSLATREQRYSAYSPASCSIKWVASGYTWSGSCDSAKILKVVPVLPASCNTGASTIYQPGPNTPAFNVAAFCGTGCPYSVQPQANYSYPPLKYTCL